MGRRRGKALLLLLLLLMVVGTRRKGVMVGVVRRERKGVSVPCECCGCCASMTPATRLFRLDLEEDIRMLGCYIHDENIQKDVYVCVKKRGNINVSP